MCTENLALHQPAWQSGTYSAFTGAERAVDGRYTYLGLFGGQCALSDLSQTAEWRVNLGGVKKIHHVSIHHGRGKSMLIIISFKIIDCYAQCIYVKLIIVLSITGINVGRM